VLKYALSLLVALLLCFVQAQDTDPVKVDPATAIVVPTFGVRGDVSEQVLQDFMRVFREAVTQRTGLTVNSGELVTQGLAGSLEPDFAYFIAELEGTRFAVSGEIRAVAETYAVSMLVADSENQRSSDVFDEAFDPATTAQVAVALAAEVERFVTPIQGLQEGSASLFISSQPNEAEVFINDNKVGATGTLDVLSLQPGSYQIEVRKEGYLPEKRHVDLKDGVTEFVNITLTLVAGGSLQIITTPSSEILIDDRSVGASPITVPALPGTRTVTLQRPGFETLTRQVQVRDYRVTRIKETLKPSFGRMVFWELEGAGLLTIDGVLQSSGYAELTPGEHLFDVRQGGQQLEVTITMPETGVFRFDTEKGTLEPYAK
jgi:PEGA domain